MITPRNRKAKWRGKSRQHRVGCSP